MDEKSTAKVTDYFYKNGLNCAESTMKYLIENGSIDAPAEVVRMMSGFGGGMQKGSVCGAVIGSVAALGWVKGRTTAEESRKPSAEAVKEFLKYFEEEFGTIYCKELQKTYVREHELKSEGMYRACTVFVEKAIRKTQELIAADEN